MEEIAERAEVSKATFFRYFSSKGEVITGTEDAGDVEVLHAGTAADPGRAEGVPGHLPGGRGPADRLLRDRGGPAGRVPA